MFSIIGQIVVGLILMIICILLLEAMRDFVGYVRGSFNFRAAGLLGENRTTLFVLRHALAHWLFSFKRGGGWYVEEGDKVYYYNGTIKPRTSWPA